MQDQDKKQIEKQYRNILAVLDDHPQASLVAVSKRQPLERVAFLAELGHLDFGENYAQEWESKKDDLPAECRWHFIGQCQSRKVKSLVSSGIHSIHSIGSESSLKKALPLLKEIDGPVFIQVNCAEEEQKGGLLRSQLDELLDEHDLSGFSGLMSIPPANWEKIQLLHHFKTMRELNAKLGYKALSMGMSSDWELALGEGATHIRVGSALFGQRPN